MPPTSNRLLSVYDQSQSIDGFKDGNPQGEDYEYDAYGNMILDRNKNIESIKYNHLNLPTKIDFANKGIIYYIYNALGVKVAKKVSAPEVQDETDYLSGFQYKNGELQFFPTAEGYVNVTDGRKFNYVYNYTDHLGNIRLSYTFDGRENELKILEENHYYPFGLKHSNYNVDKVDFDKDETGFFVILKSVERNKNQYKYNGKEFQDELGLNVYDYHNRTYDQATGRWWQIDPMAEQGRRWSPYAYAMNNPVYFIDPDGMWPLPSWNSIKDSAKKISESVKKTYDEQNSKIKRDIPRAYENTGIKHAVDWFGEKATSIGNGFDLTVKNPDNANSGIAKKDVGGRDVKIAVVDVLVELASFLTPGGLPTKDDNSAVNNDSPNSNTAASSTMSTATSIEDQTVEIKIPKSHFNASENSKSANHHYKDTTVNKIDSAKVVNKAKTKQSEVTKKFNKKHGTNF
jgi:RHS repeat-associated protein